MKEKIVGGLGDKKSDSRFDPTQLKMGIKTEMEHTNDPKKAKEIAKDHLMEDRRYYSKLEVMEAKPLKEIIENLFSNHNKESIDKILKIFQTLNRR